MTLASMTGFSRANGELNGDTWVWEVKSVNSRGLDIRCRLAPGLDHLEAKVKSIISDVAARGQVSVNLQLSGVVRAQSISINQQALDLIIGAARELQRDNLAIAPTADGLLGLRSVLELTDLPEDDDVLAAREQAMLETLRHAARALAQDRQSEGEKLAGILLGQIAGMEKLVETASGLDAAGPAAIKARFEEKIAALLSERSEFSEERLAHEAAILAVKADIREELDRLVAHIASARELLQAGGPIGRRLDFLAQEFNREANTLCSKSSDVELTRTGLDLKSTIDQFREQVQNIE